MVLVATDHDVSMTIRLLLNRMDQLQDEINDIVDDYHRLFLYYIAEHFEGITPEKLIVCDGKSDHGIDFYISNENKFAMYQCKLPELDKCIEKGDVPTYGPNIVDEIANALSFIFDDTGLLFGNKHVQEARNNFRTSRDYSSKEGGEYVCEAVLAIFGILTNAAQQRIEELRHKYFQQYGELVKITVLDYNTFSTELKSSLISHTRPKSIKIKYREGTKVNTNEWGYLLSPVMTFYELFKDHQMSLFDLNVRYYLERSPVNTNIVNKLSTVKGQKQFHLLNNGVTISCEWWSFHSNDNLVSLTKPQIINGCQTVVSIFKAYNRPYRV